MLKFNIKKKLISNRNIILCTSFLSIPYTISLIERFNASSTIITQSKEIYKFLVKFYPNFDIIFIEPLRSLTHKNPIKMIKNIHYNYLLKKKLNSLLINYSNSNVFTNIKAFSPLVGYTLLVLSKKNIIYHQTLVKVFWKNANPNLKYKILKIYYKLMFGLDFDVVSNQINNYILSYSKKFFKKIKVKKTSNKINLNMIKKFFARNLNMHNNNILLLSSGISIKNGLIDKKLFNDFMKKLSSTSSFKRLTLKRKIFSEKKYYKEKALVEAPSYIPANLLVYNYKIVIGFNSATLFEAANKSCKAISLLHLLSKNAFVIDNYKNYLNKNLLKNKKIFYPKTYEQFIKCYK